MLPDSICKFFAPQKSIFEEQVYAIAESFGRMVSAFNPLDVIVFMGSMTNDWGSIFEPAKDFYKRNKSFFQFKTLDAPEIVKNSVKRLGTVGSVAYLLYQRPELGIPNNQRG